MKSTKIAILGALLFLSATSAAIPRDYPEKVKLGNVSRQNGIGVESVQLLERMSGPGVEAVAEQLRKAVSPQEIPYYVKHDEYLELHGC